MISVRPDRSPTRSRGGVLRLAVIAALLLQSQALRGAVPSANAEGQRDVSSTDEPPAPTQSPSQGPSGEQEGQESQESQEGEEEEDAQETRLRYSETVVVSASRVEQELVNAPATVTIIDSELIQSQASGNFGDLVRQAPGVNVTQLSNRDYNVTSRAASGTLATSQLVLVDGRSVYQDFFGFVAWDLISVGVEDLERVEVVNGPASAVWGANAMSGVVNLITRAPRDTEGTTLDLRFGAFDRSVTGRDMDAGNLFSGTLTHARAVNDELAYRVSVGFSRQDAFARPFGEIPNDTGTLYPPVEGLRSQTPKLDFRLDWDAPDRSTGFRVSGGYAGTEGMLHSGLGPFQIQPGSRMAYGRVQYLRDSLEIGAFVNSTASDFDTILVRNPAGSIIESQLNTNTYDLSLKDTRLLGNSHVLSYGASLRFTTFDMTIAPLGDGRNEQGFYLSDEIFLGNKLRWIVGARADRINVVDEFIFSPRTTLLFKPVPSHSFRVSYSQAFRAPSLVNNYLQVDIAQAALFDLRPAIRSFFPGLTIPDSALPEPVVYGVPFVARGSLSLVPERLTAYEVGWSGEISDEIGATAAFYINRTRDAIDFTDTEFWSGANPPPGWNEAFTPTSQFFKNVGAALPPGSLPPAVAAVGENPGALVDLLVTLADVQLPEVFTYVNRDSITNRGFELGLHFHFGPGLGGYANYSWQDDPQVTGFAEDEISEVSVPAAHRLNAGLDAEFGPVQLGASVNYSDRARWTDVLTADYHGWTEPYTMVNATLGVNLLEGRLKPAIRVINLLNQEIQQHIFGDVLRRQLIGQLRYRF